MILFLKRYKYSTRLGKQFGNPIDFVMTTKPLRTVDVLSFFSALLILYTVLKLTVLQNRVQSSKPLNAECVFMCQICKGLCVRYVKVYVLDM